MANAPYLSHVSSCSLKLERPSGRNPEQNGWMWIEQTVQFKFVDSKTPGTYIVNSDGKVKARDANGTLFPAPDWTPARREYFARTYLAEVERFWNFRFLLIPPDDCSYLEYEHGEWLIRPNAICLYRVTRVEKNAGVTYEVVNTEEHMFRSHAGLLKYTDIQWRDVDKEYDIKAMTAVHEAGHNLGMHHIEAEYGDASCNNNASATNGEQHCYATGSIDVLKRWNVMGGGNGLLVVNAAPWAEAAASITSTKVQNWKVLRIMKTPAPPKRVRKPTGYVSPASHPTFLPDSI